MLWLFLRRLKSFGWMGFIDGMDSFFNLDFYFFVEGGILIVLFVYRSIFSIGSGYERGFSFIYWWL